jgi:DNA polymerase-3 subunit epsilon
MILGYDTETTGLPLWHNPSDDPRQPHLIQLAMILFDMEGREVARWANLVKPGPDAVQAPEAFAAHGISLETRAWSRRWRSTPSSRWSRRRT